MKGNLRIGRLVARKSADLKIEGVMLKLLRQLTELTLKHSGVVIIPIGRELSPADAGNGRRLGTRRVSSIEPLSSMTSLGNYFSRRSRAKGLNAAPPSITP
jgi:hypothetical protein